MKYLEASRHLKADESFFFGAGQKDAFTTFLYHFPCLQITSTCLIYPTTLGSKEEEEEEKNSFLAELWDQMISVSVLCVVSSQKLRKQKCWRWISTFAARLTGRELIF